jgi:hypothetical protein
MQAIEFSSKSTGENFIKIPDKFSMLLKPNRKFKIIILFEEDEEQKEWEQLTAKQFFDGYAVEDSMYDNI